MPNRVERIDKIAKILQKRNGASIKALSQELEVSEMTIRRDLEQLQLANIVSLVHGAAIYQNEPGGQERDYHLILEKAVSSPEKERIGKAAAQLVSPGDIIIIDIGTTTEHLARHIPQNCSITVLCYTINVLFEIYKKNVEDLIMSGGYYHANTQLFESPETVNLIRQTRATKFFMSAAGVSRELGLTCVNQYETGVKRACIDSSLQKILLVDSKKFGQVRPAYFAPLDAVDMVITDKGISQEWIAVLEEMNIKVLAV
jgi:DeoR family deoxyribose operon repressor